MAKDNNSLGLFKIFVSIIKLLIYFDTTGINTINSIKQHYGGGVKIPKDLMKIAGQAMKNVPSLDEEDPNEEESPKDSIIQKLWDIISKVINFFKSKIIPIIMIILTASVYPVVPFLSVLAIMLGLLKYIFYKIRKL